MDEKQFIPFYRKPSFLIGLLLGVFFLKQLIMVAILPIFQAPDEWVHYWRTQYLQEMRFAANTDVENWKSTGVGASEEITNTLKIAGSAKVGGNKEDFPVFSNNQYGANENQILANNWDHYLRLYPLKTLDFPNFYYKYLTSEIENAFSGFNVLIRFFSIRIFSAILGVAVVFFSYLASRKIGFSEINALLIAAIVSFQPMFSATAAVINPDMMLVFSFSIFVYAAVSLLRDGFSWQKIVLLLAAAIVGFLSKGPGIVMLGLGFLTVVYILAEKYRVYIRRYIWQIIIGTAIIIIVASVIAPKSYLREITRLGEKSHFSSTNESLTKYLKKTTTSNAFKFTGISYWGDFGSLDAKISEDWLDIIWFSEGIAIIGLVYLIFLRKKYPDFLPEKKILIFLFFLLTALQFAIRFYDWRVFDVSGYIAISTPGRYFLPNIVAHMLLLFVGLGAFLRNEKSFTILLKLVLVFMIILSFYSIFYTMIPYYYL